MFVCPDCWNELKTTPEICGNCGSKVDAQSEEYERRLIAKLRNADAGLRAQICWSLGSRRQRSAVPVLVKLLGDPSVPVRVSALRGLGEIGDSSAMNAVEKLTNNRDAVVQSVAKHVLKMLTRQPSGSGRARLHERS